MNRVSPQVIPMRGLSDRTIAWIYLAPTIFLLLAVNIFPLIWTITHHAAVFAVLLTSSTAQTAPSFIPTIIENLRKDFGSFNAVKPSRFTIEDGAFFLLLSPFGCGETTTQAEIVRQASAMADAIAKVTESEFAKLLKTPQVALINNLGGASCLEMAILTTRLLTSDLGKRIRLVVGPSAMMTALDMHGSWWRSVSFPMGIRDF